EACLDGRREIPLLLALGERLRGVGAGAEAALVFDRHRVLPVSAPSRLDNCYRLGDEDVPSAEQLRSAGCRRVRLVTSGEAAPDLADWLSGIGAQIPVEIRGHVAGTAEGPTDCFARRRLAPSVAAPGPSRWRWRRPRWPAAPSPPTACARPPGPRRRTVRRPGPGPPIGCPMTPTDAGSSAVAARRPSARPGADG